MAEPHWPRHTLRVGRFEFRRSVRGIWEDKARAVLLAAGLVFPSLVLAGLMYLLADTIRTIDPVAVPPIARGNVALLWLFGVFIAAQRVVSARPRIDAESLVLTTVSARTAVGGLLVAEVLRVLSYLGLPVLVLTAGATYLFGSPASAILIPLAAVLFGLSTVLVGMVLGYAIAVLVATVPFVARHKTVLGAVAVFVAMGGYLLMTLPQFGGIDPAALAVLPVGWFVDLAVIGSPVQGSPIRAVAVVVGSLLVTVGGIVLVEREATRLWYTEPVSGEEGREDEHDSSVAESDGFRTALAEAIAPIGIPQGLSGPTRRVAQWTILHTRREPRRLNFLLLPVVLVGSGLLSTGLQAESPWTVFVPAAAVLLPWVAGATFAMNPFGDEGAVLPVTLLSVPGSTYVRGVLLPGLLLGGPLVVLVTGGGALVGPFELPVAAGLVASSLLATVVAVTTAPAVGMWFPRFSAIRIGQSSEVIPPRLLTTMLHFLGVTGPTTLLALLFLDPPLARTFVAGITGFVPGALLLLIAGDDGGLLSTLGAWFNGVGTTIVSIDIEFFQLGAGALLVLGAVVVPVLAYRLAVRRYDRYSPSA